MARSIQTPVDSANLFIQSQDGPLNATGSVISVVSVTATATGTFNGVDITNTLHKGGCFFISFSTIGATCTVGVNIQGKDPVSGLYGTFARISLDGITTGNINTINTLQIYPGIVTTVAQALGLNDYHQNAIFPTVIRAQVSITATASVGGASNSMLIGLSKVL